MKILSLLFLLFNFSSFTNATSIILHTKSATVWLPQQTIEVEILNDNFNNINVHVNDSVFNVSVDKQNHFSINVLLKEKVSKIWVEAGKNQITKSNLIIYTLGYTLLPEASPFATVKGDEVFLHANIKSNVYHFPLSFFWSDDKRNPITSKILNQTDSNANLSLPLKQGDYFFNVVIVAGKDSVKFQTLVTRKNDIQCFDIEKNHAAWIDNAVIYEITPHLFSENKNYDDITAKLPELQQLGINCIWLQPVYQSQEGHQAYDVTDYFSLRTDVGNEMQLRNLIETAKHLHIKVIFDFVPNHTSALHPYAQDVITNKTNSHYYNFYQHEDDGAPYSSLYQKDSLGFYHYFWPELLNLNYNNKEVQQWIIEGCKYWLRKYDLDGFRFDAMWAVNARNASFSTQLQLALKSIKPDILLLSEDKGENKNAFKGFDAAYDWRADTNWISHWSWQYRYDEKKSYTIFTYPDESKRAQKLDSALFSGDAKHLRLRFIENNDLPRFEKEHAIQQTKMAAAFLFVLPGIPLIYNGQEIGHMNTSYPPKPIFKSTQSIQSLDTNGLFNYYKKLIAIRKKYTSLQSLNMQPCRVDTSGAVIAFRRWNDEEQFIIIMNMSKNVQHITVDVHQLSNKNILSFRDVLAGGEFSALNNQLKLIMQAESTKILLLHH